MDNSTVKTTTNYRQFKFLIDNRDTARQHINRLKDAIQKNPKILEVQPILVNDKMEIIDGQHRFTAASELGLPIAYSQVSGLDIATARDMNTLQRRWGMVDYARSYAKGGNIHYKAFLKYMSEYPALSPSTLLLAMQKSGKRTSTTGDFRHGEFIIERDQEEVEEVLDIFQKVRQTINTPFSRALAAALMVCYDMEEFDWERFISKLQSKPEAIQRSTVIRDYLRMIEDVYNINYTDANRTRLY